jgi:FkbM family methyltransferase
MIARRALTLRRGKTVLEVGANIGTQTIYFLRGGFDRVVALEPDPENLRLLNMNLSINGLCDRAQVMAVGAGASAGALVLRREQGNSGGGTFRADRRPVAVASEVSASVVTLDSLFESALVADEVGLIWIDTEGFEEEVLRGASAVLAKRIPLVFEYSPGFYAGERGARIAAQIFSAYTKVSLVDSDGFTSLTQGEMVALGRQVDIFCE